MRCTALSQGIDRHQCGGDGEEWLLLLRHDVWHAVAGSHASHPEDRVCSIMASGGVYLPPLRVFPVMGCGEM